MLNYIIRRLLIALPSLLGISVILFTVLALAPGDPFEDLANNPSVPPEVRMALRVQFGLDDPIWQRYLHWLVNMLRGDWGFSFVSRINVDQLILQRLPVTIAVIGMSQLLALAVSYCGVLLVFGFEANLSGADTALGAALVFGSAVSYAVYLVYSGAEVERLGALRLTGWATSVACLLCILQFLLLRPLEAASVAPPVIYLSLLNATLSTFVPVVMIMLAIERIGATLTAQTGMIGPLSTILMGVWLLGEPFNVWILVGTLLVLSGVALLARAR